MWGGFSAAQPYNSLMDAFFNLAFFDLQFHSKVEARLYVRPDWNLADVCCERPEPQKVCLFWPSISFELREDQEKFVQ